MLQQLSYLSLSEAAEYCDCTESQLLRLAESGQEQLELLYTVDYEDMGFGPDAIPVDTGDTEHFLAIPCTHVKELIHKGQTSVRTFLVSETSGRTATMLDILQRLTPVGGSDSVKEIRCRSEWIVKKEDLYIMRECLDRICRKSGKVTPLPNYLTLTEAAELYGKTIDQILMEATKGLDHIEILYWVEYKDIHRDNQCSQFEGVNAAGDYLVLPREKVVELRHKERTVTDCFFYPTRSLMQEATQQLRRERRGFGSNNPESGEEFLRCETILLIDSMHRNLVVTPTDLDRIWSRSNDGFSVKAIVPEEMVEDPIVSQARRYPTEMQVALEAQEKFATEKGASKSLSIISKWVRTRLKERGLETINDYTCKRIAQLITCNEMDTVLEAWEAVGNKNMKATRQVMTQYLEEERGLSPNSRSFKRIIAITTPDNKKKYKINSK